MNLRLMRIGIPKELLVLRGRCIAFTTSGQITFTMSAARAARYDGIRELPWLTKAKPRRARR
jgi:hypothetical protein